ncbi:AAA family ATPase [Acetobacterium woodii]|uniref:Putative ATPase n=1 Tax=Acetobacterium woodii (strain ATCC 29683 / DSM 1030 / JCM 2381 / KCTC 1655 / WB1) TaxID=931626 RepID=H6LDU4_ACEWD|nr:ATP-binding protein [Acetobacterium woodii]AFA47987.1 putative ATPase [Acetobacterium woodii DSM 1030]
MYTEIVKIIEGGMSNDKEKVFNYATLLADNLEKEGDVNFSKKIRTVLSKKKSSLASLDSLNSKPVDQESRMDIINVTYPTKESNEIILNKTTKNEINEFIQVYKQRNKLMKAGMEVGNSLLLYGPPGCGKTSLASYISYKTDLPLVVARLDSLISSLLGSTAKNIRKIFEYASKNECILFLDEFDVIAKLRDDKHEMGELKRVVNSLIQNIDEFSENSILIAATNHEELLDNAVWRRFSWILKLDKPNHDEIVFLLEDLLKNTETNILESKGKRKKISFINELYGFSHADIKNIINKCIRKSIINNINEINNWDILTEVYLRKNHEIENEDKFIKYLYINGVTQEEINKYLNVSLRTVREATKLD